MSLLDQVPVPLHFITHLKKLGRLREPRGSHFSIPDILLRLVLPRLVPRSVPL